MCSIVEKERLDEGRSVEEEEAREEALAPEPERRGPRDSDREEEGRAAEEWLPLQQRQEVDTEEEQLLETDEDGGATATIEEDARRAVKSRAKGRAWTARATAVAATRGVDPMDAGGIGSAAEMARRERSMVEARDGSKRDAEARGEMFWRSSKAQR